MNTLLLLLMTMVLQESPGFPYPEFVLDYYPKTVMPGDTLYMQIIAKNPHTESIGIQNQFILHDGDIRICLRDSDNQIQSLLFEGPSESIHAPLKFAEIKPGDSRVIREMSINMPPLEDLKEPFWEKHLKKLSESEKSETFSLCVTVVPYCMAYRDYEKFPFQVTIERPPEFRFETPLEITLRPEKEMTLIRKWFDNTPKEIFPISRTRQKILPPPRPGPLFPKIENVFVKGKKVDQRQFLRYDNRYPEHHNAPETWQGWKELEESLTPSTMRDEIRLSRILMQYCDTEDDAVLKELKEWFDGINVVQRTVLEKALRTRTTGGPYGVELVLQFREIYKAIHEDDMEPLSEDRVQRMRNLGLIE